MLPAGSACAGNRQGGRVGRRYAWLCVGRPVPEFFARVRCRRGDLTHEPGSERGMREPSIGAPRAGPRSRFRLRPTDRSASRRAKVAPQPSAGRRRLQQAVRRRNGWRKRSIKVCVSSPPVPVDAPVRESSTGGAYLASGQRPCLTWAVTARGSLAGRAVDPCRPTSQGRNDRLIWRTRAPISTCGP